MDCECGERRRGRKAMNRAWIKAACTLVTAFAAASMIHEAGVSEIMKAHPWLPVVCVFVCPAVIAIIEEDV